MGRLYPTIIVAANPTTDPTTRMMRVVPPAVSRCQQFSVSESGIDAGQVISERANEGVSCKSLQYKELQN